MTTKTLWNHYFYFGREKSLIVATFEWEYINIVNSSNFLLPQFGEMKSCIIHVEATNAGMGL